MIQLANKSGGLIFKIVATTIAIMAVVFVAILPAVTHANNLETESNEPPEQTSFCEGSEMTFEEMYDAIFSGHISFDLSISADQTTARFNFKNETNCSVPISLSAYKMYDTVLSHQELFDGEGVVLAASDTSLTVDLPNCMTQIDAWYGQYPVRLLDSNPYQHPNIPNVLTYTFLHNNSNGYSNASGEFCEYPPVNPPSVNQPPVITLLGSNPATVTVGNSYTDAGATAQDQEDGNITANIVKTGAVNTSVVGSYTLTYNVSDSQGLAAAPVSRTVNVLEDTTQPPQTPKGKITVCMVIANSQNVIATTSAGLPNGAFTINLATGTSFSSSTIQTKVWNTVSFDPNKKVILSSADDADCVTYSDLELGAYYYSELGISGSSWNTAKYSDAFNQPVNSVFDLYPYSPELFNATSTDDSARNFNSDGHIVLTEDNRERVLVLFSTFKEEIQCLLPQITSSLTAQGTVGQAFTYTLTGTSTPVLSVATSTLPAGLSFSTSTSMISGVPTQAGEYSVVLTAENICGLDTKNLALTISNPAGGGGGNDTNVNLVVTKISDKATVNVGDDITYTITLSNSGPNNATGVSIKDILPTQVSFISATSTLGSYSTTTSFWNVGDLVNSSSTTLTIVAKINTGTEGQKITNLAVATSTQNDSDNTNNTSTVDVNVNPAPCTVNCGGGGGGGGNPPCTANCGGGGGGGGNGPIVGSLVSGGGNGPIVPQPQVAGESTTSCYYLRDYLRKDFQNDPVEVRKLQIFLRDLEGFINLNVTGIYDNATIFDVNLFQIKYKEDVLLPWGYDGTQGTEYVYILTKKKVNEIYCKMAFPVTPLQQAEIDAHRAFWQSLKDAGIVVPGANGGNTEKDPVMLIPEKNPTDVVGKTPTSTTSGLSTLAGLSSTTKKIAGDLTANVISAGKKVLGSAWALMVWPFGSLFSKIKDQCSAAYLTFGWVNLLLVLIIIVMSYLWYRQYQNNKKLEILNKEIDLK